MQLQSKSATTQAVALKEIFARSYPVDERSATCRLLATESEPAAFLIEIEFDEARRRVLLGEGFARAALIFEALVKGRVTPCTLADIIADLRAGRAES